MFDTHAIKIVLLLVIRRLINYYHNNSPFRQYFKSPSYRKLPIVTTPRAVTPPKVMSKTRHMYPEGTSVGCELN